MFLDTLGEKEELEALLGEKTLPGPWGDKTPAQPATSGEKSLLTPTAIIKNPQSRDPPLPRILTFIRSGLKKKILQD